MIQHFLQPLNILPLALNGERNNRYGDKFVLKCPLYKLYVLDVGKQINVFLLCVFSDAGKAFMLKYYLLCVFSDVGKAFMFNSLLCVFSGVGGP